MVRAFIENYSEGQITTATLRRMYELVDSAKTNPDFQKLIAGVVNKALPGQWKNYRRESEVLLRWVKAAVDYRRDPVGVELLQDPVRTLDRGAGDCDDMSVLLAAALETLGTPVRFVTVSTRADGEPSHVYVEAFLDHWVPMDPIVKSSTVGWAPTIGTKNRRPWPRADVGLSGTGEPDLEGLGMMDWTSNGVLARRNGSPLRPNEISHTRANSLPGELASPPRGNPTPKISRYGDEPGQALPGGDFRYSVRRSIQSHMTPAELSRFVPYDSPTFDNQSLVGPIPNWRTHDSAMYPHPFNPSDPSISDLSGLGSFGRHMLNDPRRLQRAIEKETRRKLFAAHRAVAATYSRVRAVNGLGVVSMTDAPTSTDIANVSTAVNQAVQSGDIPKDPTMISQAIDLAAQLWAAKKAVTSAPAPTPAPTSMPSRAAAVAAPSSGSPWLVPAAIAAGLAIFGGVLR